MIKKLVVISAFLILAASRYTLMGSSGEQWIKLSSPPLRAVEYDRRFRIGVAPVLIEDENYFPCLTAPVKFKVSGRIEQELLPPKIVRLEPLEYPEELWENEDFARIRPYIEMWEAKFPSARARWCGKGQWCAPEDLQEGYYLVYTGRSLRAARNRAKGARAFGFKICE